GFGTTVQARTVETITSTNTASVDDVTVTGTTASDLLTVAELPTDAGAGTTAGSSVAVFLGGAPYLNTAPGTIANSRPGVAGGGFGPDMVINSIAAAGITLDGGGATSGTGDRAIIYGASENDLVDVGNATDIFGFGPGVLQKGFGPGNAFDTF